MGSAGLAGDSEVDGPENIPGIRIGDELSSPCISSLSRFAPDAALEPLIKGNIGGVELAGATLDAFDKGLSGCGCSRRRFAIEVVHPLGDFQSRGGMAAE